MLSPEQISIFEVGPRDGLQNEKRLISTKDKIRLINLLSSTGLKRIEATSFVSPKWVPQMADAEQIFAGIERVGSIKYSALTPNLKGYERAKQAGANEVAVFSSASEAFSKKNINCSIAESLERFAPVFAMAKKDGIPVRGYVSCVVSCPYSGVVPPSKVAKVTEKLLKSGCYEVSLGDTVGVGTPDTINAMLQAVLEVVKVDRIAGHYHDTNGRALENIQASLERGLRVFDSAIGGLGGCPYAPGAKGNISTSDAVAMLHSESYETGIDMDRLREAEAFVSFLKEHDK